MINPATTAADLRKAADVIRTNGLAKETYKNDHGSHCTIGALRAAATVTGVYDDVWGEPTFDNARVVAAQEVAAALLGAPEADLSQGDIGARSGGPGFDTITTWNDAADRTAEDVATLLEQAAEKLEAEL